MGAWLEMPLLECDDGNTGEEVRRVKVVEEQGFESSSGRCVIACCARILSDLRTRMKRSDEPPLRQSRQRMGKCEQAAGPGGRDAAGIYFSLVTLLNLHCIDE